MMFAIHSDLSIFMGYVGVEKHAEVLLLLCGLIFDFVLKKNGAPILHHNAVGCRFKSDNCFSGVRRIHVIGFDQKNLHNLTVIRAQNSS